MPKATSKKTFKVGDTASASKLGRNSVECKPIKGVIHAQSGRFSFIRLGPNKSAAVLTKNLY